MARSWIVSTIPVAPAAPVVQNFALDREAARAEYIGQIAALGAPQEKIDGDQAFVMTDHTTLQYTDPNTGTRVVLTTTR